MWNDREDLATEFFTEGGEPIKPMQTISSLQEEEQGMKENNKDFKAGDWVEVVELEKVDKGYITLGGVYQVKKTVTDDLVALEVEGLPYYLEGVYQVYTRQIKHKEKNKTFSEMAEELGGIWNYPETAQSSDKEEPEMVNHPAHYEREGRLETINYMEFLFGTKHTAIYCKVTSFKYRDRALLKENEQQDYKKCDWYMDKYKELKAKVGTDQEIVNLEEL